MTATAWSSRRAQACMCPCCWLWPPSHGWPLPARSDSRPSCSSRSTARASRRCSAASTSTCCSRRCERADARRPAASTAVLGRDARSAAREADAVLLGHADAPSTARLPATRALGSRVRLTNAHWFSYPGYSEILVGGPTTTPSRATIPSGIRTPPCSSSCAAARAAAATGRGVCVVGRLQRDRRAHERRADGQRRLRGVRIAGSDDARR